jgi:integrase/recombinase XerD
MNVDALDLGHGIRERQARRGKGRGERLWPWSRMTGWRAVHAVMATAGLDGPQASPKGRRHGFGVAAVSAGIPLNLVQKWLGHAQLSTTAIYASLTAPRPRWTGSVKALEFAVAEDPSVEAPQAAPVIP